MGRILDMLMQSSLQRRAAEEAFQREADLRWEIAGANNEAARALEDRKQEYRAREAAAKADADVKQSTLETALKRGQDLLQIDPVTNQFSVVPPVGLGSMIAPGQNYQTDVFGDIPEIARTSFDITGGATPGYQVFGAGQMDEASKLAGLLGPRSTDAILNVEYMTQQFKEYENLWKALDVDGDGTMDAPISTVNAAISQAGQSSRQKDNGSDKPPKSFSEELGSTQLRKTDAGQAEFWIPGVLDSVEFSALSDAGEYDSFARKYDKLRSEGLQPFEAKAAAMPNIPEIQYPELMQYTVDPKRGNVTLESKAFGDSMLGDIIRKDDRVGLRDFLMSPELDIPVDVRMDWLEDNGVTKAEIDEIIAGGVKEASKSDAFSRALDAINGAFQGDALGVLK